MFPLSETIAKPMPGEALGGTSLVPLRMVLKKIGSAWATIVVPRKASVRVKRLKDFLI
jgi:hypothetical protein